MYANLYKYVPLLVLVSDRQNIVSNHLKMFWPCRAMTFSNLPLDGPDIQQRSGWCQNQEDDLSAFSSSPLISFLHALPNFSCEQLQSSPLIVQGTLCNQPLLKTVKSTIFAVCHQVCILKHQSLSVSYVSSQFFLQWHCQLYCNQCLWLLEH